MQKISLRQKAMRTEGGRKSRLLKKFTQRKKFARKVDAELRAMYGRQARG